MKCDICGGNIVDVCVRCSFLDLNWNGEIHRSKDVYMCPNCASIFWEGFSDKSPQTGETSNLYTNLYEML